MAPDTSLGKSMLLTSDTSLSFSELMVQAESRLLMTQAATNQSLRRELSIHYEALRDLSVKVSSVVLW
jgi:hypothetical protein